MSSCKLELEEEVLTLKSVQENIEKSWSETKKQILHYQNTLASLRGELLTLRVEYNEIMKDFQNQSTPQTPNPQWTNPKDGDYLYPKRQRVYNMFYYIEF